MKYRYRYRYFPKSPYRYRYRYRYFWNCLIDIDIDIDIFQNCLINIDIDIDIFQKCRYIDNRYVISIYRTGLSVSQWVSDKSKQWSDSGSKKITDNASKMLLQVASGPHPLRRAWSQFKACSQCPAQNEASSAAFTAAQVSGLNEIAHVKNFPSFSVLN